MAALLSTASSLTSATHKCCIRLCLGNTIESKPRLKFFTGKEEKFRKRDAHIAFSVKGSNEKTVDVIEKKNYVKGPRKGDKSFFLAEGRDEDENYGPICPGCGVFMQDKDQNLPGFYKERKVEVDKEEFVEGLFEDEDDEFDEEDEEFWDDSDEEIDESDGVKNENEDNWDSEDWDSEEDDESDELKDLDGFTPAGVGYGNITEEVFEKGKKKKISKTERKRLSRESHKVKDEVTVCARCHSLRNYGQVKNQIVENLIPDFDFDRLIATRLMKPTGKADSTVVVMVVDCVDFDGSFPKRASKSLFKALEGTKDGLNSKSSKKLPKLILVATKVDLLPSQVSPTRLDKWVRHRARANGAPKLSGVYMVSARKDLGIKNLLAFIKESSGPRGNVWVIGAQNAGKSTLINAFAKKEGAKVTKLTEASIPGTTLGILRIGGILSAKAKMYDTPGLLHPYLMSMRLNRDEQKMIELRKELKPRSFRIKQGQAIHVGGLVRLDLTRSSVDTIYVTVWASPNVSLHLGKIENADEIKIKHGGVLLQPPLGVERVEEIGKWENKEIKASGISWDVNSMDVSVAGLCWFSLGLKGEADLNLWTYDGIEITLRDPLVLDRASFLEKPGFWLPKAITEAIGNQSKVEAQAKKKLEEEEDMIMI